MNSRQTHQIDSKHRVMVDAWNSKKRYVTADPQFDGENKLTVELEIVNEY
jgi:hypothetical protein